MIKIGMYDDVRWPCVFALFPSPFVLFAPSWTENVKTAPGSASPSARLPPHRPVPQRFPKVCMSPKIHGATHSCHRNSPGAHPVRYPLHSAESSLPYTYCYCIHMKIQDSYIRTTILLRLQMYPFCCCFDVQPFRSFYPVDTSICPKLFSRTLDAVDPRGRMPTCPKQGVTCSRQIGPEWLVSPAIKMKTHTFTLLSVVFGTPVADARCLCRIEWQYILSRIPVLHERVGGLHIASIIAGRRHPSSRAVFWRSAAASLSRVAAVGLVFAVACLRFHREAFSLRSLCGCQPIQSLAIVWYLA